MIYASGNRSLQQIPKHHDAHVLAYTLHKMDFEQMEMRVASCGSYKRPRTEKLDSMFNRIAHSPAFSFENVAASVHEAWTKANPEKHDAHVKAYHQDFLNQLYRLHWMTLHADPIVVGVDPASKQDSSSFWYEYGKDNLFYSPPAQTSGVAKLVSSSFRELTESIDNKLTELGISIDALNEDCTTSNSYLSFKMLKTRTKSPVFIDLSNYYRRYGKQSLISTMCDTFLGAHRTGAGTDTACYSKDSDEDKDRATELRTAELTGGMRRGSLEVFGGYIGGGKSQMYYRDESSWMQTPVTKDSNTDQTYKKRKHIPNNQEAQKDRKAKLLAKNKFFK